MVAQQIKYYCNWLQQKNYKSFYLAFLRVAISLWLIKEVWINWNAMDLLYGQSAFVTFKSNFFKQVAWRFFVCKKSLPLVLFFICACNFTEYIRYWKMGYCSAAFFYGEYFASDERVRHQQRRRSDEANIVLPDFCRYLSILCFN